MSVIWLSKAKWETVWNALHHIMIRQDFTVKTPSAGLSGSGAGAKLHIDLPAVNLGSGGGSIGLGILKAVPSRGSGRGTYKTVMLNEFGDYVETGELKPVIIPRIYHVD